MHENICPQQKENKKNIETHDFSTPTEWNVEMVSDKVIVTLSGEEKLNLGACGRLISPISGPNFWILILHEQYVASEKNVPLAADGSSVSSSHVYDL